MSNQKVEMIGDLLDLMEYVNNSKEQIEHGGGDPHEVFICEAMQILYDAGLDGLTVEASLLSGTIVFTACEASTLGVGTPYCGVAAVGMTGTMYYSLTNGLEGLDPNGVSDLCYDMFDTIENSLEINQSTIPDSDFYKVQDGDTLWDIAQGCGITVQDIIDANLYDPINNPDGVLTPDEIGPDGDNDGNPDYVLIKPGEKLKIPGGLPTLTPTPDDPQNGPCKPRPDGPFGPLGPGFPDGVGVYFDHATDGFAELSAWVGEDDGILVDDLNDDGYINNGGELVATFADLSAYDTNSDNIIDVNDTNFGDLKVLKGDGTILTLDEADIKSIDLNYTTVDITDGNGNQQIASGNVRRIDNFRCLKKAA